MTPLTPLAVLTSERRWRGAEAGRAASGPSLPLSRVGALRAAFALLLVSTTALERFGFNFGSYSLNAALVGMYGFLAVAAISGALVLSLNRVLLYGLGLALATVSAMANAERTSVASLLLLGVMYLPYVFILRSDAALGDDASWVLRTFLGIATLCAAAGVAQFFAQFFVHDDWLFDFSAYVPSFLQGPSGYNTVISVGTLHKSNGFFFREPSGFSFIMALALIGETVSYRRLHRLALFGLALLLTYSGTGLLALLIGTLLPIGRKTVVRLLVLGCAGVLAVGLLGDALNLSFTLGRVDEFGSERSSAYIRYIAPIRLIGDTMSTGASALWLGHGPGTISRESQGYEFHDPTWAKLLFEYGVLGFILFLSLSLATLRRRDVPPQIGATLFFSWLVMGGHLLSPELNFLALALVGLTPSRAAPTVDRTGPATVERASIATLETRDKTRHKTNA